jgi:hypothetical protein
MRKPYLVSYDLLTPGRDYTRLYEELKRLGAARVLLSQWVLVTVNTAAELRDHFKQFIDTNDRLLVNDFKDWASYNALLDLNKAA